MSVWIIEPHDALIFRDGRPFDPTPGVRATSLPFPFPSTTAGGVRERAGLGEDGVFKYRYDKKAPEHVRKAQLAALNKLKELAVRGPLLVELSMNEQNATTIQWLMPAPLDALVLQPENKDKGQLVKIRQLVPLILPANAKTDVDGRLKEHGLSLVGLPAHDLGKPASNAPRYWHWDFFQQWLSDPAQLDRPETAIQDIGHSGPQRELRVHIAMDSEKRVPRDGALFNTSGLEFTYIDTRPEKRDKRLHEARRLGLAVVVEEQTLREGPGSLGGERRIVTWHKSDQQPPACPDDIENAISSSTHCRVILLTPAYYNGGNDSEPRDGFYPQHLLEERCGIKPVLRAIATQRPQVVSGFDLAEGKRKGTRRLVPAGTVLYLSLQGDKAAIPQWIKDTWFQNFSDDEQSRNDGFGLAVLGTWSGKLTAMSEEKQA